MSIFNLQIFQRQSCVFLLNLFLGIFDQSVVQADLYHLLKGKPIGLSGRATLLLLAELHLLFFSDVH